MDLTRNAMNIHVLLADDQISVRQALRLLLEQEPGIEVVGEAADAAGLLLAVDRQGPDMILLDWELPGLPAAHLLRLLRLERPSLRIVAMSGRPEAQEMALAAGANGFISKGEPPDKVLDIMRRTMK